MSDIFAPLREPQPVSSLSPEEVRRGGDRLRRRRAGLAVVGAVCATAVVVAGTAMVVGDRTISGSVPDPVDSPTAQAIPAEFDLADGLPRDVANAGADAPVLEICGESFPLADQAIASVGVGHAEMGDFAIRGLSVYRDAGTARSVATDLVATFENCPRFVDGQGRDWDASVRPTAMGDQGWVLGRVLMGSESKGRFPEVTQIVRLGASLLVLSEREIHGIELDVLTRGASDEVAWLMRRQMCLLTDEGCAWRADPDVLRPDGWGPWRLGMSREEVEATGVTGFRDSGECSTVDLGSGEGLLSASDELVSIHVPDGVTTPDGIGLGSSREEVLELYWFAEKKGDVMVVRASPTADYEITLDGDQVAQMRLMTVGEGCSG